MLLFFCAGPDVQVESGDTAIRIGAVGLLAVGPVRRQIGELAWILFGSRPPWFWKRFRSLRLSAAAAVMTVVAEGEAIAPIKELSLVDRLGNPIMSIVTYLRQMVYPAGLTHFYPSRRRTCLCGNRSCARFAGRRFRGGLWQDGENAPIAGGLVLVSGDAGAMIGIMRVGYFVHADRFTYLPQIGLYVLLTWTGWICALAFTIAAGSWRPRHDHPRSLIFCARAQAFYGGIVNRCGLTRSPAPPTTS